MVIVDTFGVKPKECSPTKKGSVAALPEKNSEEKVEKDTEWKTTKHTSLGDVEPLATSIQSQVCGG